MPHRRLTVKSRCPRRSASFVIVVVTFGFYFTFVFFLICAAEPYILYESFSPFVNVRGDGDGRSRQADGDGIDEDERSKGTPMAEYGGDPQNPQAADAEDGAESGQMGDAVTSEIPR